VIEQVRKTLQSIATATKGDPKRVMEELAPQPERASHDKGPSAMYWPTELSTTPRPLQTVLAVLFLTMRAN